MKNLAGTPPPLFINYKKNVFFFNVEFPQISIRAPNSQNSTRTVQKGITNESVDFVLEATLWTVLNSGGVAKKIGTAPKNPDVSKFRRLVLHDQKELETFPVHF